MRVGWLADHSDVAGGAEYTQAEFRNAAPAEVEIVDCRPGAVVKNLDVYVIHNNVQYELKDLERIGDQPCIRYWHDVGPHLQEGCREWLDQHATAVCCSPIQAEYMGLEAILIPPPVDLTRFEEASAKVNGSRDGVVSVGSWRNYGKAAHKVGQWAASQGLSVDFYGGGMFAPVGSEEVEYNLMPDLLAKYETFVFLPMVIEPFGRLVAEAHAAGCHVITNNLVGARYWLEENPDAITTAPRDFWALVQEAAK
jgi:glycosyltransferase involved in cell wall biosynthesis